MSDRNGDARMVKLTELWERTSAHGTRYFSGFLGDSQILMFDGGERPHPTRPEETVHVWRLMVQERDPTRRPQPAPAREGYAGGARGHGPGAQGSSIGTTLPPPDRGPHLVNHDDIMIDNRPPDRPPGWRG